jgi:hypothetical protein
MLSPVIAIARLRSQNFFCARAGINPSQRVLRDRRDAEPKPRFDISPLGARAQSALSTLSHPAESTHRATAFSLDDAPSDRPPANRFGGAVSFPDRRQPSDNNLARLVGLRRIGESFL